MARYEDLRSDPVPVIKELFRFLFDVDSIEGTVLEKRIEEKCSRKAEPQAIYKLKCVDTKANRNAHMFSEKQIETIKRKLKDYLYYFGYTGHPELDNDTTFFEFDSPTTDDLS